jgi:gamma-glutamylputrescine oxidase
MQPYENAGKPHEYIDCYYSRSLGEAIRYPKLDQEISVPVCIIGGGLAGISSALGLAERGVKSVILEANRIGWGASGRNGGFVSALYSASPASLIKRVGLEHAQALHRLPKSALKLMHKRLEGVKDAIIPQPEGVSVVSWFNDEKSVRAHVEQLNDVFDEKIRFMPREEVRDAYKTKRYYDGYFRPESMQIHSLKYVHHTAQMAVSKSAAIYENSAALRVYKRQDKWCVETASGTVLADQIVYCCSAYIKNLHPKLSRATLPVATYVLLTEPLGDKLDECMRVRYATADNRTSSNYYRPLADGRLLWGGRVSMFHPSQARLKNIMMKDLLSVYPQLKGIKAEVAWGGYMGYARHEMPQIGTFGDGAWYCQGFGGHGMCATTVGGEVIAGAIANNDEDYKLFAPFGLDYAGKPMGPAIAQAAYWYFQGRDKIKEWRLN